MPVLYNKAKEIEMTTVFSDTLFSTPSKNKAEIQAIVNAAVAAAEKEQLERIRQEQERIRQEQEQEQEERKMADAILNMI